MTNNKTITYLTLGFIVGITLILTLFRGSIVRGLAITSNDQYSYLPLISKPESTPIPTTTPTKVPLPIPNPEEGWLGYLNYIRYQSGLPGVLENTVWSDGCFLHSRYMVKNDYVGHSEDPLNEWYTTAGEIAAGESNVMVSGSVNSTDRYAIDLWMSGPFHGIAILDPQLEYIGFGSFRSPIGKWQMGATLDISRGLTSAKPTAGTYPVMWPGNRQTTDILTYHGTEWPNPLSSCNFSADYWNPSGAPIYLQIGSGDLTPDVSMTSLKQDNTDLEHCVFDQTNYTNENSNTQSTGRWLLDTRDAIVIMPKDPLEAGKTYSVTITTNGKTYTWSFSTSNSFQTTRDLSDSLSISHDTYTTKE